MGRVLELVHFLHLEIDIGLDEVLGEHVALEQECVIGLETFERLAPRGVRSPNLSMSCRAWR